MSSTREDGWWTKAIIYEVYVDKFAGNFNQFVKKLDYLKYLGVNTIWILPHYDSPMIDGGYDISDFTSVRSELGTMSDFAKFVKEAHAGGFKIIIDLVLNHTSDKHPWFIESRSSKQNPKRGYYIWSKTSDKYKDAFIHNMGDKDNNWIRNEATDDYYYATFYPQQPDLNWDNQKVYDEMLTVMDFWLAKGVDGFRLDAVSRLIKRSGTNCFALPEVHTIIKKLRKDIESKYENVLLLAESGGWPSEAKPFFGDGDECQSVINFPFTSNLLASIYNKNTEGATAIWNESSGIPENCKWATFLTNHDSVDLFFITNERKKDELANTYNLYNLFGDGSGNSFTARLSDICNGEKDQIVWAFSELFRLDSVPIIYYGNEIGMKNQHLSSKPSDYREYVRGKFDWHEAEKQIDDPDSLLNSIKAVINHHGIKTVEL